jgi:hypothetical protein
MENFNNQIPENFDDQKSELDKTEIGEHGLRVYLAIYFFFLNRMAMIMAKCGLSLDYQLSPILEIVDNVKKFKIICQLLANSEVGLGDLNYYSFLRQNARTFCGDEINDDECYDYYKETLSGLKVLGYDNNLIENIRRQKELDITQRKINETILQNFSVGDYTALVYFMNDFFKNAGLNKCIGTEYRNLKFPYEDVNQVIDNIRKIINVTKAEKYREYNILYYLDRYCTHHRNDTIVNIVKMLEKIGANIRNVDHEKFLYSAGTETLYKLNHPILKSVHIIDNFVRYGNYNDLTYCLKYILENNINTGKGTYDFVLFVLIKNNYFSDKIDEKLFSLIIQICDINSTIWSYGREENAFQYNFRKGGNFQITKFLVENGCNYEQKNEDNDTILHCCCKYSEKMGNKRDNYFISTIKYFLELGVDSSIRNNDNKLYYECSNGHRKQLRTLRKNLKKKSKCAEKRLMKNNS